MKEQGWICRVLPPPQNWIHLGRWQILKIEPGILCLYLLIDTDKMIVAFLECTFYLCRCLEESVLVMQVLPSGIKLDDFPRFVFWRNSILAKRRLVEEILDCSRFPLDHLFRARKKYAVLLLWNGLVLVFILSSFFKLFSLRAEVT